MQSLNTQRLNSSSSSSSRSGVARTAFRPAFHAARPAPSHFPHSRTGVLSKAASAADQAASEAEVLKAFKTKYYYPYDSPFAKPEVEELVGLLSTAGFNRGAVPPEIAEGALLRLEQLRSSEEVPALDGRWRLVFSTATKVRPFQYIPVKEDFVLDVPGGKCALESEIGAFQFFIKGQVSGWDAKTAALAFQFKNVDVMYKGDKIWETAPKTKPKTYTFFYVGHNLAAARSSGGGVSLMIKGL